MDRLADWVEAERGRFFLLLPVAMGAAILVYFDLPAEPPLWLGLALAGSAAVVLAVCWRYPPAKFCAALALAAALGFTRAELRTAAMPPLLVVPPGVAMLTGAVAAVDVLPNGRRVTLTQVTLDGSPVARNIHVKLKPADQTGLAPGDAIGVRAILFKPDRPAYPGGWDSGRDAFFQRLGASGFAIGDVTVTAAVPQRGFGQRLRALREAIAANILAVLPVATGSVAVTLLTGMSQAMPVPEHQAFIAAGLAHLLAVAGLHVGIVMGLVFAATRYLLTRLEHSALRWPVKAIAAAAALAAGAGYAAITGAHLPILRSLAMAALVTIGIIAGRRAISLRGLAFAALFLLLTTPEVVIGVSFQMSFSAVAALISGYAAARGWFGMLHESTTPAARLAAHLAGLFYTSLLAGAASMPFAAYQFQQIQPYWILANLVAVPLTALWVLPLGLAALALMPLHLAPLALFPMGWGIAVIVWCTNIIAGWPAAMLRVTPMPGAAILLYAAGLAWLCIWRGAPRYAGIAAMLAGLAVYAAARPPDILVSPDGRLIALRTPGAIELLRRPKASSYTLSQWAAVWGGRDFTPLDISACVNGLCPVPLAAGAAVVALPPVAGCSGASPVVSPEPLHDACDAPGRVVIDRFTVWHDGAIAAWVTPAGVRLRTDRAAQGSRPWVPPWPEWRWQTATRD